MLTTMTQDDILQALDQLGTLTAKELHLCSGDKAGMDYSYTLAMLESLYVNSMVVPVGGHYQGYTLYTLTPTGKLHLHNDPLATAT